ncbi:alpha/beta hydrolase family protein [Agromyces aerolatus]|uniref:alpha/beta hydrolase family protein n=1 Tax=Agromyces sp. LY-1074 TaxID=3074080 RepID=UPI00285C515C|nr:MULTISPECIES: prolyl oligopeptidase family serine peptidase [unclassified Agromyces]MDR5698561.1 prolyl oligopeptidase family serine peptidase [Agromyces sp. LY-1074]MDR5704855.1 prolyl oligopeptidase family serine peptidase [Agromyces sp. LY-1358]
MHADAKPAPAFAGAFAASPDFDYEVRGAVGATVGGGGDVGEILAAVRDVKAKDHEGWFAAWRGLGERVLAQADASAGRGHAVSAASAYLRAACYLGRAVNAVASLPSEDELLPTFRAHHAAWERYVDHVAIPVERLEIPYEGTTLPGYFFRAAGDATARATLVLNLGSDESIADAWVGAGPAAIARGYHVLVFAGPGQQEMLFERNVPFRHDWEAVLTPVVDALVARSDVDAARLAVWGVSQAGYWVPRALAYEHRFAAAVVDPGVVDVSTSWLDHMPKSMLKLLDAGDAQKFDHEMAIGMKFSAEAARTWRFRARPYGGLGYFATLTEVLKQRLTDDEGAAITTPMLVTAPEHEQFWPGQSAKLAALAPAASTLVDFTAAEGADMHCEPLAHAVLAERAFDWLDERLG